MLFQWLRLLDELLEQIILQWIKWLGRICERKRMQVTIKTTNIKIMLLLIILIDLMIPNCLCVSVCICMNANPRVIL